MQTFRPNMHLYLAIIVLSLEVVIADNSDESHKHSGKGYVYTDTRPSELGFNAEWDPNGYLMFCLCMGRLGNQVEHFLGGLAFAKSLNRTLVLPPFRTYRNVRFTEWFRFGPVLDYHKVILAEDFLEYLAPEHWPPGKRTGFCYKLPTDDNPKPCEMKNGNPFGPFWDGLGVDFDKYEFYDISYVQPDRFAERYPPDKYPVLALRGAPAPFPMNTNHWLLQRFLVFSDRIEEEVQEYVDKNFPGEKYIGLHLRNGADWVNVCSRNTGMTSYMASPQCLDGTKNTITKDMCLPSTDEVLRLTKNAVLKTKAKVVVVATDKNPMLNEIKDHLEKYKVKVFHMDPHLPIVDIAMLANSEYFIGNCISSFTSFVTRHRRAKGLPVSFWGVE